MNGMGSTNDKANFAARELAAFIAAVARQYGPDQARVSAEDWLDELYRADSPFPCEVQNWRAITVGAAIRLAKRIEELSANWEYHWTCSGPGAGHIQSPQQADGTALREEHRRSRIAANQVQAAECPLTLSRFLRGLDEMAPS